MHTLLLLIGVASKEWDWNWISNLAKYCNLYIVTEGEWQKKIDAAVESHPYKEHLHFYYNPLPDEVRKMC